MRSFLFFMISFWTVLSALEGQEIHRLPLGDPGRCYDLRLVRSGQIYDARNDRLATEEEMFHALASYRIIFTGESHTHLQHHLAQARLIEFLAQSGKKVVVGMEFFTMGQQPFLEQWNAGKLSEEEMESEWFDKGGYNYRYYRPILEMSRKYALPVKALNIPREIVRSVSSHGIDSLPREYTLQFPGVDTSHAQHIYLLKTIFGDFSFLSPQRFEKMYAAQCVWDTAMGNHILKHLEGEPKETVMVVIVGSGHVIYHLGIPMRIARRSDIPWVSVIFHEVRPKRGEAPSMTGTPQKKPVADKKPDEVEVKAPKKDPHFKMFMDEFKDSDVVARSLGDFIVATTNAEGQEAFPTPGVKFENTGGQVVVSELSLKGIGPLAKWKKGDVLLSLNGMPVTSSREAKKILTALDFQEKLTWEISRDGKTEKGETMIVR